MNRRQRARRYRALVLFRIASRCRMSDSRSRCSKGAAHLTKAEKNVPSGVMMFPAESRALRMSSVAAIPDIARNRVVSANKRPGHSLREERRFLNINRALLLLAIRHTVCHSRRQCCVGLRSLGLLQGSAPGGTRLGCRTCSRRAPLPYKIYLSDTQKRTCITCGTIDS